MTEDRELFEELQKLVAPPHREPPPESVAALHAALARKFPPKTARRWWRHKISIGAAVFGLVAGAPAAAFAVDGGALPDPLRTALHAVGLPVDSVAVADTKRAESHLEQALRDGDLAAISRDAEHLQICLAELDRSERARLSGRASFLLLAAGRAGGHDRHGSAGDTGSGVAGDGSGGSGTTGGSESGSDGASTTGRDGGTTGVSSDDGGASHDGASTPTTVVAGGAGTVGGTSTGGSDGDQVGSSTTIAPTVTQSDGGSPDSTTTTTLQSGGGDGGSGSGDGTGGGGSGGDSTGATTTTVQQSH